MSAWLGGERAIIHKGGATTALPAPAPRHPLLSYFFQQTNQSKLVSPIFLNMTWNEHAENARLMGKQVANKNAEHSGRVDLVVSLQGFELPG